MKTLNNTYNDDIISRLINSPETLTPEEISLIQNDQELLELYKAANLCKEALSIKNLTIPNAKNELIRFKNTRKTYLHIKRWQPLMRIAAIFITIVITSIVIVAAFNPQIIEYFTGRDAIDAIDAIETITGQEKSPVPITSTTIKNIVITNNHDLIYDNISLKDITEELSTIYGIDIKFENIEAAELRLYLRIEQGKTIHDVVNTLQSFNLFTTHFENDILTIK